MKRQMNYLIVLATAIMSVASCAKVELKDNGVSDTSKITFSVGAELLGEVSQTKVHFNDWESYQLYWGEDDKISVFSNGVNYLFENTSADGVSAIFEGNAPSVSSYSALYPYNEAAVVTGNKVSAAFPAVQTAVKNGVDKDALLSVAVSEGNSLAFKNVFGLLKFKITDEDITSVTLEGNAGEIIAGNVDITLGTTPDYTVSGAGSTEIVLNPVGEFFTPGDYAIALLPVDFQAGFKLIFTHDGTAKAAIRATKSELFSVERNGGLDALNMEFEAADYKYYYIRTKEDLDAWHADYTKWATSDKVYLANDIDYKGGVWEAQNASGTEFKGLFDGRGHSILNIHMESANNHAGFLRRVTGTVKNLTIGSETDDSYMYGTIGSGDACLGVIARLANGTVDNVINYAEVNPGSGIGYCGAIVGRMQGGTVTNCKNYGAVECSVAPVQALNMSGIVGMLEASYTNSLSLCENHGALKYTASNSSKNVSLGGIVGQVTSESTVSESDNYGAITVTGSGNTRFNIGGIVGINQTNAATISNCDNANTITNSSSAGTIHIGGILGSSAIATSVSNCNNTTAGVITDNGTCTYEYSSNTTVGAAGTAGIVGASTAATTITDCTNSGSVSNNSASVYMAISGVLGYNVTAAATLTRCKNLGAVTCTPKTAGTNQVIRMAGMLAVNANSGVGTTIDYCENYGDITLNNSYTVSRAWLGGAVAYCNYAFITNGKYYATLSKGTIGGGKVAAILGQAGANSGTIDYNGLGGIVGGTAITESNYNSSGIQFNANGFAHGRTGNYFLSEKPSGAVATAAELSHNTDNTSW